MLMINQKSTRKVLALAFQAPRVRHRISRHSQITQRGIPYSTRVRATSRINQQVRYMSTPVSLDEITPTENNRFQVTAPYDPTGDQPQAIQRLVQQVQRGDKFSILKGATGTGKTNVMAHVIARLGRPTLVLCHNKTLAAQLARELRNSLRNNHVQLFVSYYNHYVPESFNEVTNKYTAKKSSINDELDALRHLATRALVEHKDVVIVASVSCIYGMGMPKAYLDASMEWTVGQTTFADLDEIMAIMKATAYVSSTDLENDRKFDERAVSGRFSKTFGSEDDLDRGQFQLSQNTTGATLLLWPPSETFPMRIDFDQRSTDNGSALVVSAIGRGTLQGLVSIESTTIFPAKHHIVDSTDQFEEAILRIQDELQDRIQELKSHGRGNEADRLAQRVSQDLQLLRETGTCPGIENYSRHMALREAGQPPDTLLDYFGCQDATQSSESDGQDWLLLVDESHVTLPQLKAMYGGDRARKEKLVKHGYRLPSALDNRPLREDEFWERIQQAIFVSATPAAQELNLIDGIPKNDPIDMIIRPTFVCDPEIHVRPTENQLEDLLAEIRARTKRGERTLAMALTKRDAEDLSDFLIESGVAATYIHSGLNTHDRSNALKSLQSGQIDCLVGVNLLREGLDLPQVSLVAVLNADSEGFLRSESALLQIIGRAARNVNGTAVMYANRVTGSMKKCMDVTSHRRKLQLAYNEEHGKEMVSTKGSSVLSIFDLLKDEIEAEKPKEVTTASSRTKKEDQDFMPASSSSLKVTESDEIVTDHIPSKPGVYFWKDMEGNTLYIGKAKRLRSRIKSYLSTNAKHGSRIRAMLKKAKDVEFVLTPSDRDALILESNLIKAQQPPYNVLMKDDQSYPYICASVGDAFPQFTIAPRRQEGARSSNYRYFGPYPHYSEINNILNGIEEKYNLRAKNFQARYGDMSKAEYQSTFDRVLSEVFETTSDKTTGMVGEKSLKALRYEYEEASKLFASDFHQNTDVVAVGSSPDGLCNVVHVLQLRQGVISAQFSYEFDLELGEDRMSKDDFGDAIHEVLDQLHYPSGESSTRVGYDGTPISFFPDEVLTQYPLPGIEAMKELKDTIRSSRKASRGATDGTRKFADKLSVRTAARRGVRKESDLRALQCAVDNAQQAAKDRAQENNVGFTRPSWDEDAVHDLANLLSLKKAPRRIERYDISHTQGQATVASRIVFLDGKPAPELYRRFNVRSVVGVDDYASLEEVLERRFRRAWKSDGTGSRVLVEKSDPWTMPDLVVIDGGKGQLHSAVKGMAKANIYPKDSIQTNPFKGGTSQTTEYSASVQGFVPIVSLAKEKEEVFVLNQSEPVNDVPDSLALLLLRAVRDESHRYALRSHRQRRSIANGFSHASALKGRSKNLEINTVA